MTYPLPNRKAFAEIPVGTPFDYLGQSYVKHGETSAKLGAYRVCFFRGSELVKVTA
jgi:hypothetical protein